LGELFPIRKGRIILEQGWKKKWARFLVAAAILFGVYKGMEPDRKFNMSREYAPNDIQQEFIKLSAQRHKYVAFGNTKHSYPEIAHFAYDQKTVRALEQGGSENYIFETKPSDQSKITALQQGNLSEYDYAENSSWLCSNEARKSLNATFNQSAKKYNNIRFIAADKRKDGGMKDLGLGPYDAMVLVRSILVYNKIYGCMGPKALVMPLILTLGTFNSQSLFSGGLTDDTATSDYIGSYPGKSAIFYGAGHFQARPGIKSMRNLLPVDGKTITVINIFRDAGQKQESDELDRSTENELGKAQPPDAVLYVTPPPGNPDGIEVISPEAAATYRQAKENLRNLAIN
jgi:hypothetical protein